MDPALWAIGEAFQGMIWSINPVIDQLWAATPDDILYDAKRWGAQQLEGVVHDLQKVVDLTGEPVPPHGLLEDMHRTMSGATQHLNDLCEQLTGVDLCEGDGFAAYRDRWQKVTQHKESITDFLWQTVQDLMQIVDHVMQIINLIQIIEWGQDILEASVALIVETAGISIGAIVGDAAASAGEAFSIAGLKTAMREIIEKLAVRLLENRQVLGRIFGTIGGVVIGVEAVIQKHEGLTWQSVQEVAFDGMM